MSRTVEPGTTAQSEQSKTVLRGKERAVVVYRLEKQDMTVRLSSQAASDPIVELALGTEARSFSLGEFVHFWLTMIEVGLKRDIAGLESDEALRLIKKRQRYKSAVDDYR